MLFLLLLFKIVIANPWYPINELYVQPTLYNHISSTIDKIHDNIFYADNYVINNLNKMKYQTSAYWLDSISKLYINNNNNPEIYVEGILNNIINSNKYKAVTFILYNLPNRDCNAISSNGNICCNKNEECKNICTLKCQYESTICDDGVNEYKNYINNIYDLLNRYPTIRKILILEPDSLPNCITAKGYNGCTELTCNVYITCIQYAIDKLHNLNNVYLYIDIAHGGWLGSYNYLSDFVKLLNNFNTTYLQGFSTNIANYNILGEPCNYTNYNYNDILEYCIKNSLLSCCYDPCNLILNNNMANNELNYVQIFYEYTKHLEFATDDKLPHFVIDTSRNGNSNARNGYNSCKVWCNINNAKIGLYPTTNTSLKYIDAYSWLKTPGESDGCIDFNIQKKCMFPTLCNRYDPQCGINPENIGYKEEQHCPPEAGQWFDYQIIMLNK